MATLKTQKLYAEIEARIREVLRGNAMRQCEIADYLPPERYIEVGHVIRDMAARGVITRERDGASYIVRLSEDGAQES